MSTTIIVRDLSSSSTQHSLLRAFAPFGEITAVKVGFDHETGRPLDCATIVFVNEADAQRAVNAVNRTRLDGQAVRVRLQSEDPGERAQARLRAY